MIAPPAKVATMKAPVPRPFRIPRCVVEMRSAATAHDPRPAFLTSVLTLRDGKVCEGRTYSDLRQSVRRPVAS